MHSCTQVMAALSDYLDDELGLELRRELEAHLSECVSCQAIFDSTRKTLRIVTETRSFELPQGLSERLMDRIARHLGSKSGPDDPSGSA